jgi:hypothetical protein
LIDFTGFVVSIYTYFDISRNTYYGVKFWRKMKGTDVKAPQSGMAGAPRGSGGKG